jgi:hypothetical protein
MILALSLQSEINKIGAYAGFAAIIGLALLVLLYFAQARELRRLSDWVEQEGDRARGVPVPSASPRPTVIPQAGVVPPAASAVTTAVPGVRRVAVGAAGAVPAASAAAAATSATVAAAPLAPASAAPPLTPATAVAPLAPATAAGADATRVAAPKSDLPPAPEEHANLADGDAAPADGAEGVATPPRTGAMPWGAAAVPLAAAPAATAEPSGLAQEAEAGAPGKGTPQDDEYAPDTAETAAAAAALPPSDASVVSVPPVVGAPADPPKAEPATSKVTPLRSALAPAAAAGIPAKPADAPAPPPPTDDPPPLAPSTPAGARPRFPPAPDVRAAPVGAAARVSGRSADAAKLDAGATAPTRRRERERPPADDDDRPPGLGAPTLRLIAAAVVIVAVLIFVASRVLGGGSSTPPGSQTTSSQSSGVSGPSPSTVRVAVLNGTHTTGLATSVSATLVSKGFRKGAIADAPVQTHTSTIVGYTPGNRAAAVEVAADLSLSSSQVQLADSASTAVADTHHATSKVIVTLGSDFSQQ